jgi:hypothetical protein
MAGAVADDGAAHGQADAAGGFRMEQSGFSSPAASSPFRRLEHRASEAQRLHGDRASASTAARGAESPLAGEQRARRAACGVVVVAGDRCQWADRRLRLGGRDELDIHVDPRLVHGRLLVRGGRGADAGSSNPQAASIPSSVTVAAGEATVFFAVDPLQVVVDTPVTFAATYDGKTATVPFTVKPPNLKRLDIGAGVFAQVFPAGTSTVATALLPSRTSSYQTSSLPVGTV